MLRRLICRNACQVAKLLSATHVKHFTAFGSREAHDAGMMNQATTLQRVRMPMIAIAAFALGALASSALPQLHLASSTPAAGSTHAPSAIAQAPSSVARPVVTTIKSESTTACGQGAYVSGDMVGDASPAAVYATMCGH